MITKYKDYSGIPVPQNCARVQRTQQTEIQGTDEASKIKTYVIKVQSLAQVTEMQKISTKTSLLTVGLCSQQMYINTGQGNVSHTVPL